MKTVMFKCPHCGDYTFQNNCPECNVPTVNPLPARYSPIDRYGKYRRALKNSNKNLNGVIDDITH